MYVLNCINYITDSGWISGYGRSLITTLGREWRTRNCIGAHDTLDRFNAERVEFADNLFALRDLRAGDDFVGCAGEDEVYSVAGVRGDGCGKVQGREVDGFGPVAVGVIVAAGVELAAGDGVVADAFAVAVAIN